MQIVKTDDCSRTRKAGELVNKKSEINRFLLLRITKNATDSKLIINQLWLIFEICKDTTNIQLFRASLLVVYWLITWVHSFIQKIISCYVLELSHSHHLVWTETGKNQFSLFNVAPSYRNIKETILIFFYFTILEEIHSTFQKWSLLLLWVCFIKDHTKNLISLFINEHHLCARNSFFTFEIVDIVHSAENTETQHSLVKIRDRHLRFSIFICFDMLWSNLLS